MVAATRSVMASKSAWVRVSAAFLRAVVNAMLSISHTGCQWRFLPESLRMFGLRRGIGAR